MPAATSARITQRELVLIPSCSTPRPRIVCAMPMRVARHAGSAAASSAAPRPNPPASASDVTWMASCALGVATFELSAAAVVIIGRSRCASPIPSGIPTTTPAAPSKALSFKSSPHTMRGRTPMARRTPNCHARPSNKVARLLKAIRNEPTNPSNPSAQSSTWKERMTVCRSALRWLGGSTCSPVGAPPQWRARHPRRRHRAAPPRRRG